MVGEKKEEDIVGRLEALRKKVPPPTTGAKAPERGTPPATVPDEGRRKLARVIGIIVIIAVLGGVFFVGSKFLLKPQETLPPMETFTPPPTTETDVEQQARIAELAKAKKDKTEEVNEAFAGLPGEYATGKDSIIQEITISTTKTDVESIDYDTTTVNAWRNYKKDEVDRKVVITGGVIAKIGDRIVKGVEEIKSQIDVITLSELKGMEIGEMRSEYIPIRLSRDQSTGGFAKIGDKVNIHYRWTEKINGTEEAHIKYLAKDGKVMDIMRAAETISLSESEAQRQTGGGTEGTGNVTSITVGQYGISISDGPYGASVGVKSLEKSSSYTVNLAEVQKAAAASKISEEELLSNLEKYGVRLSELESKTNIGDFSAEYLMLVEVSEQEASEVALRILDSDEKANILITISETS
jgi:hypothetical protein